MPKRTDIHSILIIGAGPIVIGQACEFDYSGVQSCCALKEEGYRVILVNSNPATIMTDPDFSDVTYIEPLTVEIIEKILIKERPDAILPTMGGQTALNIAMELDRKGILKQYNIEMLAARPHSIAQAEDRLLFRQAMERIGLETPKSVLVKNLHEALGVFDRIDYPLIIRPSFTLGGQGGGIAYNLEEYKAIVLKGLSLSPVHEILVEESVLGWKEYEMEVVRDCHDNAIIVCSIENVDPMGIHTGDSITVAPAMTLTDKEYQCMRNASINVLREIGITTGGSNVQFAVNPKDGRMLVIEMNPRVSRSSALASKATGFPIAKIATKLAIGYTLDELINDISQTPASFEPSIDYVVVKVPRFNFEKFPESSAILGTSMKSVGEVMAMGGNFQEALYKALNSMEIALHYLDPLEESSKEEILVRLRSFCPDRLRWIAHAFRQGMVFEEIKEATLYDDWFLYQIYDLIMTERFLESQGFPSSPKLLRAIKGQGFSDGMIGRCCGMSEIQSREKRQNLGVFPIYRRVDSCAGEFETVAPYLYSSYQPKNDGIEQCEGGPSDLKKVVILGSGPNRIGQGIEFDYCCVHACLALKTLGYESIMINCNPETVSTDYNISDRLYFEPLTLENVLEVLRLEQTKGELVGIIVQLGGQTPLKLAQSLKNLGFTILGTQPEDIALAEDRQGFQKIIQRLGLMQPRNSIAYTEEEAFREASNIGYPLIVRPSFVLGGQGMAIVYSLKDLQKYIARALEASGDSPILLDQFLEDALEIDVEVLCDAQEAVVVGILQHIERAGIHSGDSSCSLPPYSLTEEQQDEITRQSILLAKGLKVKGLLNIQYAFQENILYLLEANPRASRTAPFVSKFLGLSIIKIATEVMLGGSLKNFNFKKKKKGVYAVKEAVFPFERFPESDVILGPEMKSTGEVMGWGKTFEEAFGKAQLAAGIVLPLKGKVLLSLKDTDKSQVEDLARRLLNLGFELCATSGTAKVIQDAHLEVEVVRKVREGRPHCVDKILSGEIHLVFNTTFGERSLKESLSIRQSALSQKQTYYYTTIEEAFAAVSAIEEMSNEESLYGVTSLQEYFH